MRHFLCVIMFLMPLMVKAQDVIVGMSDEEIGIDTFFDGSDLFVYGAIRQTSNQSVNSEEDFDVIVTLASPREPVTVRRKDRRFGIWVNVDSVTIDLAPHFYAIATTRLLDDVLNDIDDTMYSISTQRFINGFHTKNNVDNPQKFLDALQRIRKQNDLYQVREGSVNLKANTLFSTSFSLPANLTDGQYEMRIFITQNGHVVGTFYDQIDVAKVGVERLLYDLAHEKPILYGLLSLAIAIFAGWAASAVFRFLRP